MAGGLSLLTGTNASIPTPPAGKVTIFFSTDLGAPAYKTSAGLVFNLLGPQGPVGPVYMIEDGIEGEIGPPGAIGPAGGSGTSLLQIGTLEISNSQFDNGNTTPLDIVAAPGAGKVIIPVDATLYCNVSVSKGQNPTQRLRWNGDTQDHLNSVNLPLNNTGEAWRTAICNFILGGLAFANATFDPRNKSLQWSMSANTGAGTGTGKVRVAYYVADMN